MSQANLTLKIKGESPPLLRSGCISEHCQPGEGAVELQDDKIWMEAVGVLQFRYKRTPKEDLRGTRRHPFIQKKKRAAKPAATVADAVQ